MPELRSERSGNGLEVEGKGALQCAEWLWQEGCSDWEVSYVAGVERARSWPERGKAREVDRIWTHSSLRVMLTSMFCANPIFSKLGGEGDAGHDRMSILRCLLWLQYVVQSCSPVWRFVTTQTAAHQASLYFTISQSLFKLMCIKSMMPSNHPILCGPLLLLPSIFPSIRVFSSKLALCIGWPKYWSLSFSISPSSEYSGLISF